ncbi:hypothetical protein SAMN05216370_1203 [Pseudomonas peli]|uniref:ABC transporter substrate-binding protein n=1 Tax=Pseudomonas peli TaxID=592361 RepID=A0AB37Z5R9_9PSED|nr:hypothetical protein [Pseudomonas peli]NMZ68536.1 hypothetical protein [Pseudomonas peli]SCW43425.1 hypothetical protein SAMN05216370_1203 [Pseudomonas peli]
MKKIITATLFAGLFTSAGVFAAAAPAADIIVVLASNVFQPVGTVANKINIARQGLMTAQPGRAGFVKNSFDFTVSANVIAGVLEQPANSRFGVVAGSNKGYSVFTGSSVGGSISQCGPQVAKDKTDLGASLVVDSTLDMTKANGCAIVTP